jgi:predicted TPR repeat methyltransferase
VTKGKQGVHHATIGGARQSRKTIDFYCDPWTDQAMTLPDLTSALTARGPDETLRLYRDWAASYEACFVTKMQYRLPGHVAGAFLAAGGVGPVLDVGAGTGLLAFELRRMGFDGPIDGIDFSPEMLGRAAEKGVYRDLVQADVTQPLPLAYRYKGIVSSGTFTAGHVGPVFGPLLAVAAPGALFALSVNERVWTAAGFDKELQRLQSSGAIHDLHLIEVEVYGQAARALNAEHGCDRAPIAMFRTV